MFAFRGWESRIIVGRFLQFLTQTLKCSVEKGIVHGQASKLFLDDLTMCRFWNFPPVLLLRKVSCQPQAASHGLAWRPHWFLLSRGIPRSLAVSQHLEIFDSTTKGCTSHGSCDEPTKGATQNSCAARVPHRRFCQSRRQTCEGRQSLKDCSWFCELPFAYCLWKNYLYRRSQHCPTCIFQIVVCIYWISNIIVKTCGKNSQTTTSPQVLCVVQKVNSEAISVSLDRFRWFAMGDNNLSCWHVLRLFHRARLLDIPESPCTWFLNTGPKCFSILTCFILFRSLAQFLAAIWHSKCFWNERT